MSFLTNLTARLPFAKKVEQIDYYFALNIGAQTLTAALWSLSGNKLQVLETASDNYSSEEEIIEVTDRLLDAVLGTRELNPEKILFGVPDSWLIDENLKEDYLKLLRKLVKELELSPMAYVSSTNALIHFLEKTDGVPITAILVGLEEKHLATSVARAGKSDGTKYNPRSGNAGTDIEKALLNFTNVEVLPSKILLYGLEEAELEKLKAELLSYPWMSKLSFLHFPKIEVLTDNVSIVGVCYAGASEFNPDVSYSPAEKVESTKASHPITAEPQQEEKEAVEEQAPEALGFVVGDVSKKSAAEKADQPDVTDENLVDDNLETPALPVEAEDFDGPVLSEEPKKSASLPSKSLTLPAFLELGFLKRLKTGTGFRGNRTYLLAAVAILLILTLAYLFLPKASVKVYVEPKVLENDTQVTADPTIKSVDEDAKKIPGEIVETDVSGSGKGSATGKKQVGDPAKGTVVIRNKTDNAITVAKATSLSSGNGLKFSLDLSVTIASRSAEDGTWGKTNGTVTASSIGPDSNLPSGTDLTVSGYSTDQLSAKAEGNFSGGTSKEVTVVSSDDQQKLLAQVAADLRKNAQQKLQDQKTDKKILAEALTEQVTKKSFSKGVGDQASDFSVNVTAHYKGTAFDDKDLRLIVSKLVSTNVPQGFNLDIQDTETQADVSKVEKDGRVIFLARFKAKLIPKLDTDSLKKAIKGKSVDQARQALKSFDNVLDADFKLTPNLPFPLNRIPFFERNITVDVGLK